MPAPLPHHARATQSQKECLQPAPRPRHARASVLCSLGAGRTRGRDGGDIAVEFGAKKEVVARRGDSRSNMRPRYKQIRCFRDTLRRTLTLCHRLYMWGVVRGGVGRGVVGGGERRGEEQDARTSKTLVGKLAYRPLVDISGMTLEKCLGRSQVRLTGGGGRRTWAPKK
eukprot:gene23167-biopygen22286